MRVCVARQILSHFFFVFAIDLRTIDFSVYEVNTFYNLGKVRRRRQALKIMISILYKSSTYIQSFFIYFSSSLSHIWRPPLMREQLQIDVRISYIM